MDLGKVPVLGKGLRRARNSVGRNRAGLPVHPEKAVGPSMHRDRAGDRTAGQTIDRVIDRARGSAAAVYRLGKGPRLVRRQARM